jgi:hypothetical protein
MTITWGRGFFRLWVVLALGWILFAGVLAYRDTSVPSLTRSCSELRDFTSDSTGQKLGDVEVQACEAVWRQERIEIVVKALAPPIIVLLLWVIFSWTVRGFRQPPRQ